MEETRLSQETFIDPVCLMGVTPGKKDLTLTYRMRTYYFCAISCRKAFETNPDKYLGPTPKKRKKWWAFI